MFQKLSRISKNTQMTTTSSYPPYTKPLAKQLGVEVAEVETCPTFVLGSNAVIDSHAVDTIEGLKPDIVVVSKRYVCTKT